MKFSTRVVIMMVCAASLMKAQERTYEVHSRGTLHQTVFNTGEIARSYTQGNAGNSTSVPLFEWPAYSRAIIDQKEYDGQHNTLGGGVWIGVSPTDTSARLYSLCGGVGASTAEITTSIYTFPLSITRTENFPLLPNGDLNPAYNPNEAEEVIVAKWGTNVGITVTRTSRSWSHPDYDDFIIYEYEFENTGDRDGKPSTIESNATLRDVLFGFVYGLPPSMFGYFRNFNRWYYLDMEANTRARFDQRRWLLYSTSANGMPEPNGSYFTQWSSSKRYGGGLLSPQAVGFSLLYYDTTSLTHRDASNVVIPSAQIPIAWDATTGKLRQPWAVWTETSNTRSSKVQPYLDIDRRVTTATGIYDAANLNKYDGGEYWTGRARGYRRTAGVGRVLFLGPYHMPKGQKVRIALAEVAGYGAATLEETRGGVRDHDLYIDRYQAPPNWYIDTTFVGNGSHTVGSKYLSTNPIPDYVNSKVVTVRDVTDRAIQAYSGYSHMDYDTTQYKPEGAPSRGVYSFGATYPSPVVKFSNTPLAENVLSWGTQVEAFNHPRLSGSFSHYEVLKANHPLGPWTVIATVPRGDSRYMEEGMYEVKDASTAVGQVFYYAVVSVDNKGNKSGKTNMRFFETQIGGTDELEKVYVVPNPFIGQSGFSGTTAGGVGEARLKIGFYNLPKICTIRIYSYSGQLVQTIEHQSEAYSVEYLQVTRNNQMIASGVYFFVVETPEGKKTNGKFVIIH